MRLEGQGAGEAFCFVCVCVSVLLRAERADSAHWKRRGGLQYNDMRRHSAGWWVHSSTALWFFNVQDRFKERELLSSFDFSLGFVFRGGCS